MADLLLIKRAESSFPRVKQSRVLPEIWSSTGKDKGSRDHYEMVRSVRNTIQMYWITGDDIYNFDEKGLQMGVIGTAKIVTYAEREGKAFLKQPGNREWVTVVEALWMECTTYEDGNWKLYCSLTR
ncbi:hypothetical protein LIPSTDRAFT_4670 [Lipomyces starkeyi NRRL Y-11557]|uniref:DDE-1 domain-containing protein n=1 Tax=Lipomyces starkeyi NRRL Y-11557 TaxID=675824 RepID=A0A1E3Q144_LIPST|nr:hypothetical protein LIPSTDRAFT_4670 [Lipomyces starkeyi NRRL Y-11557]